MLAVSHQEQTLPTQSLAQIHRSMNGLSSRQAVQFMLSVEPKKRSSYHGAETLPFQRVTNSVAKGLRVRCNFAQIV